MESIVCQGLDCNTWFEKKKNNQRFCSTKCCERYHDKLRRLRFDRLLWRRQYYKDHRLTILKQNEESRQRHIEEDLKRKRDYYVERKIRVLRAIY